MDSHKIEFECIQWIKYYLADYIINGKSTTNVLRSVRDKSFTIPVGGTVEVSGVLWRQASASFTPISQKRHCHKTKCIQLTSSTRRNNSGFIISLWHSDLPFQHVSSIGSVSCNNFTVSPRLGDSRDGGEQYLWHCEKLILCTCKIVHLGNIKLKKIGSKPKHQCENKKCNGDNHEWTKWNGRLVQPRQSILKVMHSVLLPSTPSKPSTHHALISIHIYIDIEIMYTINTTIHASKKDKESISGGVTELPHWFWEPAAVAVRKFPNGKRVSESLPKEMVELRYRFSGFNKANGRFVGLHTAMQFTQTQKWVSHQ